MELQYSGLKISVDNSDGKWYVYYRLKMPDGTSKPQKEHGKSYKISLMTEPDLERRSRLANKLMGLVQYDLDRGINPKNRDQIVDNINKAKLAEAQKADEEKIDIDSAIQILKEAKGWINPVEGKETSATVVLNLLNSTFKPFLQRIGKADDVRQVTRWDITDLIEENFNRVADESIKKGKGKGNSKVTGWGSSSCGQAKTRISSLFSVLIDKGLLEVNPTTNVKIKKDSEKIIQIQVEEDDDVDVYEPWSDEEATKWFKELHNSKVEKERAILISSYMLYYAFIRKSEMLRLKFSMIDFKNECFNIPAHLTKSARKYKPKEIVKIDMPDNLIKHLKRWIAFKFPNGYNANDYLLCKDDTKQKYVGISRHFEQTRKRFDEQFGGEFIKRNIYAMKHTGVIKLYHTLMATDMYPAEIQKILQKHCRHSDWSETENYLRNSCKIEFKDKTRKVNF